MHGAGSVCSSKHSGLGLFIIVVRDFFPAAILRFTSPKRTLPVWYVPTYRGCSLPKNVLCPPAKKTVFSLAVTQSPMQMCLPYQLGTSPTKESEHHPVSFAFPRDPLLSPPSTMPLRQFCFREALRLLLFPTTKFALSLFALWCHFSAPAGQSLRIPLYIHHYN